MLTNIIRFRIWSSKHYSLTSPVLTQDEEDIDCDERLNNKHRKKKNKVMISSRNWSSVTFLFFFCLSVGVSCQCVCQCVRQCVWLSVSFSASLRCLFVQCSPSRRCGSASPPSSSPPPAMASSLSTSSPRFWLEKICFFKLYSGASQFQPHPFLHWDFLWAAGRRQQSCQPHMGMALWQVIQHCDLDWGSWFAQFIEMISCVRNKTSVKPFLVASSILVAISFLLMGASNVVGIYILGGE